MRAHNVHVGDVYEIKISGRPARVRLMQALPGGGYHAVNIKTGRAIRLRSGRRLRYNVTLFEQAKAYYADIALGNEPSQRGRDVIEGDFDGCEAELSRIIVAARQAATARLLAAAKKGEAT
jgi:hypothetical protein